MATAVARYTYKDVYVPRFDFTTPVAHEGRTQYFPVRHFCKWLGIDPHDQVEWVNKDSRFQDARRDIPYKTGAGWRPALWIRRDKLALWLLHIEPSRCKLGSRDRLETFQTDVLAEAEATLFGGASHTRPGEASILLVLGDLVCFVDELDETPEWMEQMVNLLIRYAEARGIDRDRFVSAVLTAEE